MIVVADSGSTKTEWALALSREDIRYIRTSGYNPYFNSKIPWEEELSRWLRESLSGGERVEKVYYYGAGCDRREARRKVENALRRIFPGALSYVDDDLTGAAKGLYGKEKGVALILGTGSNAGIWDGEKIIKKSHAVGYLLGDHGSGAALGLRFVRAWFDNELPEELVASFCKKSGLDRQKIKEKVYLEEKPNYFLASFVPFLLDHLDENVVREMVEDEFGKLFRIDLLPLCREAASDELRVTGSVAWYFRELLETTARSYGVVLRRIVRYPLKDLTALHLR